ncbi:MAG: glycine cleavage T C-terminal barrel domain-containing protein, partial [Alphaproteobacteria bacterium]
RIAGIGTLILRTSAVGEPTLELFVAAGLAGELWRRLSAAGQRYGIRPVGRLAERLMRLEMGHLDSPGDCRDLARILPDRPLIRVGFSIGKGPCPSAGQAVLSEDGEVVGRVLAAALSPALGCGIGIAIVAADRSLPHGRLLIAQPVGPSIVAAISETAFRRAPPRPTRPVAAAAEEQAPSPRQSPVHDRLSALGAAFLLHGGGLVAETVGSEEGGPVEVGLLDLSAVPRLGLLDPEAAGALLAMGLPPAPELGVPSRGGGLIGVQTATDEVLVLPEPAELGHSVPRLLSLVPEEGCPGLLKGDMEAWFVLAGPGAANCLGTATDGAPLRDGKACRRILFGCETFLIPAPHSVHLLVETPLAGDLWDGIYRHLQRCGGRVLGLAQAAELL